MSYITNITDFKKEIRRCRELKIPRQMFNFSYTHHVFVGEVDDDGCDLYHSTIALLPAFKLNSPGKITKVRLDYTKYKTCKEVRKIFNFDNGDVVIIVDRDDYPHDEESEEVCIERANLRLGEERYSASENNCESYVNWIFSNDNTSKQIKSSTSKQIVGNAVDGLVSTGILHPAAHSVSGAIHYSESSKEENTRTLLPNSKNMKKKTLSEKLDERQKNSNTKKSECKKNNKLKEIKNKDTGKKVARKESMNTVKSPEDKTLNEKRGDTLSAFEENTKITKSMCKKIENTRPRSFNDICQAEKMKEDTQYFDSHKTKVKYEENKAGKKSETKSQIIREESKKPPQQKNQTEMENMRQHKAQELIEKTEHLSEQNGELMKNKKDDRMNMEQINEHMDNKIPHKSEINLTNIQHSYSTSNGLELDSLRVLASLASSTDCSFIPKQVAKKVQKEGIKNLSKAGVYFSVGAEAASLSYSLYKIHTNESSTEDQKIKSTFKETYSSLCGVTGSVLGQACIPIPVVGCLIGGVLGHMYAHVVGGLFVESVTQVLEKR